MPQPVVQISFGTMEEIVEGLGSNIIPFRQGDIIEVTILAVSKHRILINIQDLALGIVPAREFSFDTRELEVGATALAYVLVPENEDGYVVLSFKRADRERLWKTVAQLAEDGAVMNVRVSDANKGGLVINYGGVEGFLPLSQLAPQHFPRSRQPGDAIPQKVRDLVGKTINVKILSYDEQSRKLIFSEKAVEAGSPSERLQEIKLGDRIEGSITGIVDFGLFVDIGAIEGLVHISEVSWDRVENLRELYEVGEKVDVEVISVDDARVSLSVKRLKPDPWQEAVKQYTVGQRVEGDVTRITPFGAFVRLDPAIEGLVHISEILEEMHEDRPAEAIAEILSVGSRASFVILSIEPQTHRIALSYRSATKKT